MDAVGSSNINTNYGSYSDCESVPDVSRETDGFETTSAVNDSSSIGSFSSGRETELADLYDQRAQAEAALGEAKLQRDEIQLKVNVRVQERLLANGVSEEENESLNSSQEAYAQILNDKAAAQQELNRCQRESGANDKAIHSNVQ